MEAKVCEPTSIVRCPLTLLCLQFDREARAAGHRLSESAAPKLADILAESSDEELDESFLNAASVKPAAAPKVAAPASTPAQRQQPPSSPKRQQPPSSPRRTASQSSTASSASSIKTRPQEAASGRQMQPSRPGNTRSSAVKPQRKTSQVTPAASKAKAGIPKTASKSGQGQGNMVNSDAVRLL